MASWSQAVAQAAAVVADAIVWSLANFLELLSVYLASALCKRGRKLKLREAANAGSGTRRVEVALRGRGAVACLSYPGRCGRIGGE